MKDNTDFDNELCELLEETELYLEKLDMLLGSRKTTEVDKYRKSDSDDDSRDKGSSFVK